MVVHQQRIQWAYNKALGLCKPCGVEHHPMSRYGSISALNFTSELCKAHDWREAQQRVVGQCGLLLVKPYRR